MKNHILLFSLFAGALALASNCQAMWRKPRVAPRQPSKPAPKVRMPVACEKVSQIKKQNPLPHTPSEYVRNLTAPQPKAHLKYDELCHKVAMKAGECERAQCDAKSMAKRLAVVSFAPAIASVIVASFIPETPALLIAAGLSGYSLLAGKSRFDEARQSWKNYKNAQNKMKTAEQELADLVAEQKFQFKVPYDIQ